jgi:hypothetical protein
MKQRYRKLVLLVLAMASGVFVLFFATTPNHRINKASYDQIKDGMSKTDIELLIGVRPGLYCDRSVEINLGQLAYDSRSDTYMSGDAFERSFRVFGGEGTTSYCWISSTGVICTNFDENDIISSREFYEVKPISLWDRIQSWMLRHFIY